MSSLQGYYGLSPAAEQKGATDGFEMAVYRKGAAHYLEDGPFAKSSHSPNPPLSQHRKTKSAANCLMLENGDSDSRKWIENLKRLHEKPEADLTSRTPEKLLKENTTSPRAISAITGKGLALRPKSANKTASGGADGEAGKPNPVPIGLEESLVTNGVSGVRKSSSLSCLAESENGALSSIWPTSMWSLKPDFQALSTIPIFDGLPKPANRRNKAALD